MIGMALGVTGKTADEISQLRHDHSNPADRWMESGREWRPALNLLTFYAARTRTKKTITSCWDTVAELDWEAEEKGKAPSCACRLCWCCQ